MLLIMAAIECQRLETLVVPLKWCLGHSVGVVAFDVQSYTDMPSRHICVQLNIKGNNISSTVETPFQRWN